MFRIAILLQSAQPVTAGVEAGSLIEHTGLFNTTTHWVLLGGVFLIIGLVAYGFLWVTRGRDALRYKPLWLRALHIVAYVPGDESRAWPHVLAGVCSALGVSFIVATVLIRLVDGNGPASGAALVTTASFVFAVFISAVTFWVLWQTAKLEHQAGFRMFTFLDLIKRTAEDVTRLVDNFGKAHRRQTKPHHRLYLITTNPFFGTLTYPDEVVTTTYRNAILSLAAACRDSKDTSPGHPIEFQIICGNPAARLSFHQSFFASEKEPAKLAAKLKAAGDRSDQFLSDLTNFGVSVKFVAKVPPTQFMVIGDTVYEFTIESQDQATEILYTDLKEDRKAADRFAQNFAVFWDHLV